MDQMSGGTWGMGAAGFIVLLLAVLLIAALIKFLSFR
jgi:hypothetical protein